MNHRQPDPADVDVHAVESGDVEDDGESGHGDGVDCFLSKTNLLRCCFRRVSARGRYGRDNDHHHHYRHHSRPAGRASGHVRFRGNESDRDHRRHYRENDRNQPRQPPVRRRESGHERRIGGDDGGGDGGGGLDREIPMTTSMTNSMRKNCDDWNAKRSSALEGSLKKWASLVIFGVPKA